MGNQINKSSEYFNTKLYTGTGATQSITGVGFQPNLVWIKNRSALEDHFWYDQVRGISKLLKCNSTVAEATTSTVDLFNSFDTDGFTIGNSSGINGNGNSLVAWNFKAGGTAVSNTQGTIASSVSANTTSGFSIVSVNTTGASGTITCGHGLGVAPSLIIWKNRSTTAEWQVYHKSLGTNLMQLNTTGAEIGGGYWGSVPTSTVFSVTTNLYSANYNYIAYCFAEKKGFSKFGSYTGNGSADGTFVYTGFKPAFVLAKSSTIVSEWHMSDDARYPTNPNNAYLAASSNAAEVTGYPTDFLSNGFKIRTTLGGWNSSGATFIYMAFAENPLVGTNNIPACAR